MKANVLLTGSLGLALLTACAPRTPSPTPPPPRPVETAAPAPQPVPRPAGDWRDAPLAAGAWRWAVVAGRSTASFGPAGQPLLVQLACVTKGTVQLTHAGALPSGTPLGITTSAGTFPLMSDPGVAGVNAIVVTLPASAPVLDALVFSRGRFVIEVAGLAPSYLPSWPEVARVVEDCR